MSKISGVFSSTLVSNFIVNVSFSGSNNISVLNEGLSDMVAIDFSISNSAAFKTTSEV